MDWSNRFTFGGFIIFYNMPSDPVADAKVRDRAVNAFNNISGGAEVINKSLLADAMKNMGLQEPRK